MHNAQTINMIIVMLLTTVMHIWPQCLDVIFKSPKMSSISLLLVSIFLMLVIVINKKNLMTVLKYFILCINNDICACKALSTMWRFLNVSISSRWFDQNVLYFMIVVIFGIHIIMSCFEIFLEHYSNNQLSWKYFLCGRIY